MVCGACHSVVFRPLASLSGGGRRVQGWCINQDLPTDSAASGEAHLFQCIVNLLAQQRQDAEHFSEDGEGLHSSCR